VSIHGAGVELVSIHVAGVELVSIHGAMWIQSLAFMVLNTRKY
jgi:hypothetical protein